MSGTRRRGSGQGDEGSGQGDEEKAGRLDAPYASSSHPAHTILDDSAASCLVSLFSFRLLRVGGAGDDGWSSLYA